MGIGDGMGRAWQWGWNGDAAGAKTWDLGITLGSRGTAGTAGREGHVATGGPCRNRRAMSRQEGSAACPPLRPHPRWRPRPPSVTPLPARHARGACALTSRAACVQRPARGAGAGQDGGGADFGEKPGWERRGTVSRGTGNRARHGGTLWAQGDTAGGPVETLGAVGASGDAGGDTGENGGSFPGDAGRRWRGFWAP